MSNKFQHQYEIYYRKATVDFVFVQQVVALENHLIDKTIILFHLQQAAEKYLKSILSYKNIHFAKLHDIKKILELCIEKGISIPLNTEIFIELTPFAVEGRYDFVTDENIDIQQLIFHIEQLKLYIDDHVFITSDGLN